MALTDTLRENALNTIESEADRADVSGESQVTLSPPTFGASNQISATALSSTPNLKEAPEEPLTDFRSFVNAVSPDTSALTGERDQLRGDISDTIDTLSEKGARQTEVEEELGVPEDRQRLRELNMQVAQLQKEFDTAITNEEGVARPVEFITGRQAHLEKQRATQIGALSSVAQALQGNIALAEQTAETTVEREFADEEARLRRLEFEYTENKEDLERADKKGSEQLALFIDERKRVLADKKEERRGVLSLAQEAAMNGAPNSVVSRMAQAQTQEEALSSASGWLGPVAASGASGELGDSFVSTEALKSLGIEDEQLPEATRELAQKRIKQLGTGGEREKASSALAVFDNAETLINLLDEGVNTGPLVGRIKGGTSLWGIPITPSARNLDLTSDEANEFKAAATIFTANFIKSISGAQVSDKEREFLMAALPDENNSERVNRANIRMLTEFIANRSSSLLNMDLSPLLPKDELVETQSEDDAYLNSLPEGK